MGTRSRSSDCWSGEDDEARPARTSHGAESPSASSAALHFVCAATSLAFTGSLKRIILAAISISGIQFASGNARRRPYYRFSSLHPPIRFAVGQQHPVSLVFSTPGMESSAAGIHLSSQSKRAKETNMPPDLVRGHSPPGEPFRNRAPMDSETHCNFVRTLNALRIRCTAKPWCLGDGRCDEDYGEACSRLERSGYVQ